MKSTSFMFAMFSAACLFAQLDTELRRVGDEGKRMQAEIRDYEKRLQLRRDAGQKVTESDRAPLLEMQRRLKLNTEAAAKLKLHAMDAKQSEPARVVEHVGTNEVVISSRIVYEANAAPVLRTNAPAPAPKPKGDWNYLRTKPGIKYEDIPWATWPKI